MRPKQSIPIYFYGCRKVSVTNQYLVEYDYMNMTNFENENNKLLGECKTAETYNVQK